MNNNPVNFNDPMGEKVKGVNIGGGLTLDPAKLPFPGFKGNASTIIAFDTDTYDISVVANQERGIGKATTTTSFGGFINFLNGNEHTTLDDLTGSGLSLSGSVGRGLGINVAFSAPDSGLITHPCNGCTTIGLQGPVFSEVGLALTTGGEFGVTRTQGTELFRTSIIGDTIDAFKNFGSTVGGFFGFGSTPSPTASGGFVLYPSKPNNNQMRQVYSK